MRVSMTEINAKDVLKPFRDEIDMLDREIISLLGRRFEIVDQVGKTKAKHKLSQIQPERMQEVLDIVGNLATQNNLAPEFVQNIYKMMIEHAHSLEFAYQEEGEYE